MPATVTTLGAVHSAPRQNVLTLAGTERILIRSEFRHVAFYHQFEINDILSAVNPQPGDTLLVSSEVYPMRGHSGRLILRPVEVTNYGHGVTTRDSRKGYVLACGVNQMHVEGVVAATPRRVQLDAQTPVVNASLIIVEQAGLLETVSYGLTAISLEGLQKGDRVWLQGRLLNEKRPSADGKTRLYSRLETYRQTRSSPFPPTA